MTLWLAEMLFPAEALVEGIEIDASGLGDDDHVFDANSAEGFAVVFLRKGNPKVNAHRRTGGAIGFRNLPFHLLCITFKPFGKWMQ